MRRLYYRSEGVAALDPTHRDQQFTAAEHAAVSAAEIPTAVDSRAELFRWYLGENHRKLGALGRLIARAQARGYRRVISLGSGPSVLEAMLVPALPPEGRVVATDFDRYVVERARDYLPELDMRLLDFLNDDLAAFLTLFETPFDVAVFFGSSYVMDDARFVNVLATLREQHVGEVIDFQAGYLGIAELTYGSNLGLAVRRSRTLRRLVGRPPAPVGADKFHGFGRTRQELRRLYRAAGWRILEDGHRGDYPYYAVLGR